MALYRSSLDDPQARPLLEDGGPSATEPCPSPDGTRIVCCRQGRAGMDLWLVQADGGAPRELYAGKGREAEPAWSPDGEWICFATWDGSNFRIAVVRADGSALRYVTPAGVDSRAPVWVKGRG